MVIFQSSFRATKKCDSKFRRPLERSGNHLWRGRARLVRRMKETTPSGSKPYCPQVNGQKVAKDSGVKNHPSIAAGARTDTSPALATPDKRGLKKGHPRNPLGNRAVEGQTDTKSHKEEPQRCKTINLHLALLSGSKRQKKRGTGRGKKTWLETRLGSTKPNCKSESQRAPSMKQN